MSVNDIAPLSPDLKRKLRPWAVAALWFTALFVGVQITMQIAILRPYPGINDDIVMRSLSHTMFFVTAGTIIKTLEVKLFGPWVERLLGTNRKVELKGIFNKEIRWDSFIGALFNAIYSILFIALVHDLTPTALGAGRSLLIVALAAVEIWLRILPREKRTYIRLAFSLPITIIGACIVLFAKGWDLDLSNSALILFLILVGPGNLCLVYAEMAEYRGVHKRHTAAPVYTLSRCVWYSAVTIAAVAIWGVIQGFDYNTTWAVLSMYGDRWYLILPIALFWGLIDLVRISSKVIVSTTFIYVIGAAAVVIEVFVQEIARRISPTIYHQIPPGAAFFVISLIGGVVIWAGSMLFPHPKKTEPKLPVEMPLP